MNGKRMEKLDQAWLIYEEFLRSQTKVGAIQGLTFAEWLHIEYRKAQCPKWAE